MPKVAGKSTRFLKKLDEELRDALERSAMLVEDQAQEWAPVWTGTMMRSVTHTPARWIGGRLQVRIGPGPEAPYAPFTELKKYRTTKTGKKRKLGPKSQMKNARMPWLKPALESVHAIGKIEQLMRNAIVRAVNTTR